MSDAPDRLRLTEHVRAVLAIDPTAPAVEHHGRWSSWGELATIGDELDGILRAAGLGAGAPVACLLRNRTEHVGAFIGLLVTERPIVTVNPGQGEDRLAADLCALRPAVVVADREAWTDPVLRAAVDDLGAVGVLVRADPAGAELVTDRSVPSPGDRLICPDGTAVQMLTSGTTGPPKRIPLYRRALEDSVMGAAHYESARSGPRLGSGVRLVTGPLVHISGIWDVLTSVVAGRRMAMLDRFRVDEWYELVRRHRPKAVSLVPTALRMVLAAELDRHELSSIQVVTCGTAPIEPETALAFEDRYGIPVLVLYGATEFAGGVAGWTLEDHRRWSSAKRGSVGRAHPGIELRVVDADTGTIRPNGEVGLLEVRAPQIGGGREWTRTTDLAELDDDGFLWIRGRSDDAIIRGGFKIVPADVQKVLEAMPGVREAAVIGLPEPRLGAVPVAAIEREPGVDLDVDDVMAHARANLIHYQVPVAVVVVDALPRTPSLKVSRPDVRALFEPA